MPRSPRYSPLAILLAFIFGPAFSATAHFLLFRPTAEPEPIHRSISPPRDNILAPASNATQQLHVYYTTNGHDLAAQTIRCPRHQNRGETLKFVLDRLLEGPPKPPFRSTIPAGTRLRAAYLDGPTAIVDLAGPIRSRPIGGPMAELLCVQSNAHTIAANLPEINATRLLIDGRLQNDTLWEQVDIHAPIRPDPSFLQDSNTH